jgi:hypothetical protein
LTEQQNSGEKIGNENYGQNEGDEAINARHSCRNWREDCTGHELKNDDKEGKAALCL